MNHDIIGESKAIKSNGICYFTILLYAESIIEKYTQNVYATYTFIHIISVTE